MKRTFVILGALAVIGAIPAGAKADGAYSEVRGEWSNRCLDIKAEDGPNDGARAQIWDCTGAAEQQFVAENLSASGTTALLLNKRSGRCLEAEGTYAGAPVDIWDCNAYDSLQQWDLIVNPASNANGYAWFRNRASGMCLTDTNWNASNGTFLTVQPCVGGWLQYWEVPYVVPIIDIFP